MEQTLGKYLTASPALRLYYKRKSEGVCTRCGKARNPYSVAYCTKHMDINRDRMRRLNNYLCDNPRMSHHTKPRTLTEALIKASRKLTPQALLKREYANHGLCPRCGGDPEPGRKHCTPCLKVHADGVRRRKQERKTQLCTD